MIQRVLIKALKMHLTDLLEEEVAAKEAGNQALLQGLQYARINLETTLEKCGVSRTVTLDNSVSNLDFECN